MRAGAVFFMISDSALSFNLFQKKFEGARLLVMTTYYAAQVLIALSAVDSVSGGLTKGAE